MTWLALAWALAFAIGATWMAWRRNRLMAVWAVFGAILGPVALVLLWISPPGRCASCHAPVRGWVTECEWCGMDIRGHGSSPTTASRPLISVAPMVRPGDPRVPSPTMAKPSLRSDPGLRVPTTTDTVPVETAPTKPAAPRVRKRKAKAAEPEGAAQVITSGIFVTGTVGLAPGSRYTIQIAAGDLHIIGPADRSPKTVAFERGLAGVDATGLEGRLVISAPGTRGGTVLVFQSLEGGDSMAVARSIMDLVKSSGGGPA